MYIMAGRDKSPKIITEVIEEENTDVKEEKKEDLSVAEEKTDIEKDTAPDPEDNKETSEKIEDDKESQTITSESKTISSFRDLDTADVDDVKDDEIEVKSENVNNEAKDSDADLGKDQSMTSEEAKKWLSEVKPEITEEKTSKKGFSFIKFFFILLIVLGLISLVGGGVYYYNNKLHGSPVNNNPSNNEPQITATATPTVVEDTVIDYSTLKVNILNGSGIAGEAGRAKDLLSNLEFSSVETGNASSYDFTDTIISLKENVDSRVYEELEKAFSDNYSVTKNETPVDENSDFDIIITVGSDKPAE